MNTIENKIARIIGRAAMIDDSQVRPETNLTELGVDSLARIECVLGLEDAFKIELDQSDLWKVKTVQDVIDLVDRALSVERASC
ncbi:MAG TPA: acyl carrier protein [Candidatus Angelobacter sp.]|jgi:acyl carrier protein|nr:acyl carrier protein [Candidatus Angelobacter sp.]